MNPVRETVRSIGVVLGVDSEKRFFFLFSFSEGFSERKKNGNFERI